MYLDFIDVVTITWEMIMRATFVSFITFFWTVGPTFNIFRIMSILHGFICHAPWYSLIWVIIRACFVCPSLVFEWKNTGAILIDSTYGFFACFLKTWILNHNTFNHYYCNTQLIVENDIFYMYITPCVEGTIAQDMTTKWWLLIFSFSEIVTLAESRVIANSIKHIAS